MTLPGNWKVTNMAQARAVLDVVLAHLEIAETQQVTEGSLTRDGDQRRRRWVLVIPLTEWEINEEGGDLMNGNGGN